MKIASVAVAFAVVVAFGCGGSRAQEVKPDVLEKITAALPAKAPAAAKQPRKVLIFSKTMGFRHGSIPVGAASLKLLGEKTGAYTAVHSEDDAQFLPENLQQYDAVIMLNTTGDIFKSRDKAATDEQKKAQEEREERLKRSLVEFVRGGKGLAGTHSATDTYHGWKEYNDMMGGTFAGHPWHQKVPVRNLAQGHPLNAAFGGQGFEVTDEIYQFRKDTARWQERRMLLALDSGQMDVSKGNREDGFYPVSWIGKYGAGRTFYCSLGHRDEIYYHPAVLQHYLAGFQYVLGDLEADATPQDPATAR